MEIALGTKLCPIVCSYWNTRRAAVLVKLTEWVVTKAGLGAHDAETALLSAIEFIEPS